MPATSGTDHLWNDCLGGSSEISPIENTLDISEMGPSFALEASNHVDRKARAFGTNLPDQPIGFVIDDTLALSTFVQLPICKKDGCIVLVKPVKDVAFP